jgi:hypothetical protein
MASYVPSAHMDVGGEQASGTIGDLNDVYAKLDWAAKRHEEMSACSRAREAWGWGRAAVRRQVPRAP